LLVEVLVGTACSAGVETVLAPEVLRAQVVNPMPSVSECSTSRILAASGHGALALSRDQIKVRCGIVVTCESSVELSGASVVSSACCVNQVPAISNSNTFGVFACCWCRSLASLGEHVEVFIVAASSEGVDTLSALEVSAAKVVDNVESVSLSDTSWVLAVSGYISLALSGDDVEVSSSTSQIGVESIGTLEVVLAEVVDEVESSLVIATRIFTSSRNISLALTRCKVEVLSGSAS
jgi:hypothetical protein